jgi:hypothetical protein
MPIIFSATAKLYGGERQVAFLTMSTDRRKCGPCGEAFVTHEALNDHRRSDRHRRNFYAFFFKENRLEINNFCHIIGQKTTSFCSQNPKMDILSKSVKIGKNRSKSVKQKGQFSVHKIPKIKNHKRPYFLVFHSKN